MSDSKNLNATAAPLTYDDVRSVSPALEHYTRESLLSGPQAQVAEVLTHIAFYAGWPCAMSALSVVKDVFAGRVAH